MAVNYKDLKEKSQKSPLTESELAIIDSVEKYIDKEIHRQYKSSGNKIHIDLHYADFSYLPGSKNHEGILNLGEDRVRLMRKELDGRYKKAGWKINTHLDDGLDGPNLSGPDYWILSGK
jgi:hypothetical protein